MKKSLCCLVLCFAFSSVFTYSMEMSEDKKFTKKVFSEEEQEKLNKKYITKFGSGKSEIFAEKIIPLVQLSAKCVIYKTTFIESLNEAINKDWENPTTVDEAIKILKKIDDDFPQLEVLLKNCDSQSLILLLQKNPKENVLANCLTLFIDNIVRKYKNVSASSIDSIKEEIKNHIKKCNLSDEFRDSIHAYVKNDIMQQNYQLTCTQKIDVDCDQIVSIVSLKLSSDGKLLAVGIKSNDKYIGSIIIYNSKTGDKLYKLNDFYHKNNSAKFKFDGENVFYPVRIGHDEKRFVSVNLHNEKATEFNFRIDYIYLWILSPNGKYLAIITKCSDSKSIQLWNIATGECVKTFENYKSTREISSNLKFSPDSKYLSISLATVGDNSCNLHVKIVLWDIISGTCKFTVNDFTAPPAYYGNSNFESEFSSDSKLFVIAFEDFVRVISVKSGEILQNLKANDKINKLAFSDDNTYLLGTTLENFTNYTNISYRFNMRFWQREDCHCLYNIKTNRLIKKFTYWIKTIRWLTKEEALLVLLNNDIYKLNMVTNECRLLIKESFLWRPVSSANNKCIAIGEGKCIKIYSYTKDYNFALCLSTLQNSNTNEELIALFQSKTFEGLKLELQQWMRKEIEKKKIFKNTYIAAFAKWCLSQYK